MVTPSLLWWNMAVIGYAPPSAFIQCSEKLHLVCVSCSDVLLASVTSAHCMQPFCPQEKILLAAFFRVITGDPNIVF